MSATIITPEDLHNLKTEIIDEIQKLLTNKNFTPKQWLKSAELRDLLDISPGTLQNLRVNGHLPYTKVGGTIYYAYDDVNAMLESNKRN